jgi:FkbM family methyltransferase
MDIRSIPWRLRRRVQVLLKLPERFLRDVRGVIHVGANTGQERQLYAAHGLRVLWIEPIPEIFAALKTNIAGLSNQRAVQYLVTDADDVQCDLNIANNNGESSSILDLKEHRAIWPEVSFSRTIRMSTTTLDSLLSREGVDVNGYDALVMDTQGSELMVLRGGERSPARLQVREGRGRRF